MVKMLDHFQLTSAGGVGIGYYVKPWDLMELKIYLTLNLVSHLLNIGT